MEQMFVRCWQKEHGRFSALIGCLLVPALFLSVRPASAQGRTWYAQVGAESHDQSHQANAFLPNEMWINEGDTITWTFVPKNEPHTVTFLIQSTTPEQVRPLPPPPNGPPPCPPPPNGTQASGSSYNGSACVTSTGLDNGSSYSVTFTTPGNYKLVCLFHADMNGVIHVLPADQTPPHDQGYYDRQAQDEARDLLTDNVQAQKQGADFPPDANVVIMTGEVSATAGGRQYMALLRFVPDTIQIHAGETVEWINSDPTEPHTVTFGTEPASPNTPVGVMTDSDGALHATITSPTQSVSTGFLQAAPQDRSFLPQSAPGTTRLRVTFPNAGTYHYICALHDMSGMLGTVIVLP